MSIEKIGAKGMKLLKTLHLILVMMWTVGIMTMAIIGLLDTQSGDELYMKFKIMRFIDDWLVIPGATLTVISGVVYGVWTGWGFFKHKWITVKWIVSIASVIIGTFLLSPWLDANLETADALRDGALADADLLYRSKLILFSGAGFSVSLIFLIIISVFKPWKVKKTIQ